MNENISNSFTILKNFIEKISQKSNTHDKYLDALGGHIINKIDLDIEELNSYIGELNTKYNNLESKIKLEEYRVDDDTHYYSLKI